MPMLTLAEFIRNMIQRWFHDHYRAAQTMCHQLTDAAHLVLLKRVEKCGFLTVNPVDWNIFSVKRFGKQWTVYLAWKTCTCNKFQMNHFPCSHALAATRKQAGRPRAGRHVLSSDRTTTQSCRRCGQPGHNSRRCSNPPMINEGPSRGVPDEYRRKSRHHADREGFIFLRERPTTTSSCSVEPRVIQHGSGESSLTLAKNMERVDAADVLGGEGDRADAAEVLGREGDRADATDVMGGGGDRYG
ncbi:hypothetical protein Ddye_030520 [Dipteronia dyeriana]|uniref:SWIM-type domain-containing protein n=1 Tax=Dipteronia dyeriana TaxID=168575 RepID=A0AAD9TH35_9ROSI|nr:hypothetical protein Ddye_030520 [Dipteronia dyeriana]